MQLLRLCSQKGNDKFKIICLLIILTLPLFNVCGNQNITSNFINMRKYYVSVSQNKIIKNKEAQEKKINAESWNPVPADTSIKQLPHQSYWSLSKKRQKDCKSQRISEFAVTLSHRNVRSCTHKFSPICLPKCAVHKNNNRFAAVDWGTPSRPNFTQRTVSS